MPTNKQVAELIVSLKLVEKALTDHLIESGTVKTDIVWLKRLTIGIASGMGTLFVTIVGYILLH